MPASVAIKAHAKLNLALSVGPPEPASSTKPGYHPIVSWFSAIELADELSVRVLPTHAPSRFAIRFADDAPGPDAGKPASWPTDKDLVFRAHALLEREVARSLPVDLSLTKRIPAGGGLGGGSSDAAATLLALNQLFELGVPIARLGALGATLGSDVPYFLDDGAPFGVPPRPAFVTGFGERIERVPRMRAGAILAIPPFPIPTQDVYRAFDRSPVPWHSEESMHGFVRHSIVEWEARGFLLNGLRSAAEAVEPRLAEMGRRFPPECPTPLYLSGSGSTLFRLCPLDRVDAELRVMRAGLAGIDGVALLPTCLV